MLERLGDHDDIYRAGEATLTRQFEEYEAAAPVLVDHHNFQRQRFEATYGHYVRIFTSLETLESIRVTSEAIAPGYALLEEIEVIHIPATIAKATLYGGGALAVVRLGKVLLQANQASRAVRVATGRPIGAANKPPMVKAAKSASRWKAAGAVGAIVTVASSTVGIVASIENVKRRMEFLRVSVESCQNWYSATLQEIEDLSAGSKQMEDAIDELLDLLGFTTAEELEAYLGGAVQKARGVQGALKAATRMLCASPPLNVSDVATYTGLPNATFARRAALIQQDPSICNLGG